MVTCSFVTTDNYFVDGGLLPFKYSHFNVNGVAHNSDFYRYNPEKEIPIIHV